MPVTAPERTMTIAEFHALPRDETVERELIRGELWEQPMTRRNKWHARVESIVATILNTWLATQPEPRGAVYSGEIGCDLPIVNSSVGIDVAYCSAEIVAAQDDDAPYLVGAPVLVVEILSPSDTIEHTQAKIRDYLEAGVALVWEVDPSFRTVRVYERDRPPRMVSGDDDLSAEPHLSGFTVAVRSVFER